MKRAICLLAGMALAAGVSRNTAATAQAEAPKPPPGFIALFNGRNLDGWQASIPYNRRMRLSPEELAQAQKEANARVLPHWSVVDGVLTYDGKGDNLQTVREFGNFELFVDWKIEKGGDSGIYLRGVPQVQIWENPIGSGGLYNNQRNPNRPLLVADRPVGEWNTFHIRMVGDRVTVRLNGQLVVDNTPLENYWERDKPLPVRGPIELQHHGNPLWFRNIYLKELP